MQLTLDTNDAGDVEILKALASVLTDGVSAPAPPAAKGFQENAATVPAKTPAKKAAAAAPAEETPEAPADDAAAGPTMKDAVTRASQLMSQDRTKDVKAALDKFGVSRVSELADDQLAGFIAELR